MLFTNITGKKESKSFNEEVVIVCPTVGEFRLTPKVQKKLDVKDGDFIVVSIHPEDADRVFLAKGITGVELRDEDGVIQKDGRGRTIYEEGTGFGAVARQASEGSSLLKCTGAAAWNAVGGDSDFNQDFSLGEGIEGGVYTGGETETGDKEIHNTVFYELIFKSKKAKAVRKSADGLSEEDIDIEDEEGFEEEV